MFKGSSEPNLNMFSNNLSPGCGDISWSKLEKSEDMAKDNLLLQPSLISGRKRVRNIGSKSKRLLMDSVDVLELRLTWEETQELLRPPQSAKPSICTVEDHEFEEYDVSCSLPVHFSKAATVFSEIMFLPLRRNHQFSGRGPFLCHAKQGETSCTM